MRGEANRLERRLRREPGLREFAVPCSGVSGGSLRTTRCWDRGTRKRWGAREDAGRMHTPYGAGWLRRLGTAGSCSRSHRRTIGHAGFAAEGSRGLDGLDKRTA